LILGVWGILKIKAHVLNPQQTSLWEGVSRLVAGGAFFSLPVVIEVARNTISPATTGILGAVAQRTTFNEAALACDGTSGLDGALYCMMNDLLTPVHVATNFFTTCAAFVFAMIGISRLMKTAQDGARGPGGLGTIMTFAAAGALLSYNSLVRAATVTLSLSAPGLSLTATRANMMYTKGLSAGGSPARSYRHQRHHQVYDYRRTYKFRPRHLHCPKCCGRKLPGLAHGGRHPHGRGCAGCEFGTAYQPRAKHVGGSELWYRVHLAPDGGE
jgi:hypothetical protein